jgi:hypothetical protein
MNRYGLTIEQIQAAATADFISDATYWGYRDDDGTIHR